MDTSIRFRIATRIHHALMRELGEGIDVAMMLGREPYAREVLQVCNACGNRELVRLARHFRAATEQEERAEREEAALHAAWMRHGSGLLPMQAPAAPRRRDDVRRVGEPATLPRSQSPLVSTGASAAALAPRRWFGWFGLGVH
jgi:hypothetical protein